jgi:hypothetical protein
MLLGKAFVQERVTNRSRKRDINDAAQVHVADFGLYRIGILYHQSGGDVPRCVASSGFLLSAFPVGISFSHASRSFDAQMPSHDTMTAPPATSKMIPMTRPTPRMQGGRSD